MAIEDFICFELSCVIFVQTVLILINDGYFQFGLIKYVVNKYLFVLNDFFHVYDLNYYESCFELENQRCYYFNCMKLQVEYIKEQ